MADEGGGGEEVSCIFKEAGRAPVDEHQERSAAGEGEASAGARPPPQPTSQRLSDKL